MNSKKIMELLYILLNIIATSILIYFLYRNIVYGDPSPKIYHGLTVPYIVFVHFFVPKILENMWKFTTFIIYGSSFIYLISGVYLYILS